MTDGPTRIFCRACPIHAHLGHVPNCTSSLPSQSGEISIEEFIHGMRGRGLALDDEQFKGLHDDCDNNHDGQLTLIDFTKSLGEMHRELDPEMKERQTQKEVAALEATSSDEEEEEEDADPHWAKVCAFIRGNPTAATDMLTLFKVTRMGVAYIFVTCAHSPTAAARPARPARSEPCPLPTDLLTRTHTLGADSRRGRVRHNQYRRVHQRAEEARYYHSDPRGRDSSVQVSGGRCAARATWPSVRNHPFSHLPLGRSG